MTKEEILKKIKKIEISSNILANEVFSGSYRSFFKGNGVEFSNIRRYAIGDDVKKIDWKVSARHKKTYVKEFDEERELSIYLLIDISNSNNFVAKQDLIAQLVGSIAFGAIKNDDKVGAIFFSDDIEELIPLKKGKKQALIILDKYFSLTPKGKGTSISKPLDFINKIAKNAIVFLISDFIDENYEQSMNITRLKHDLIPIKIQDKRFITLPKGSIFTLIDAETNEEVIVMNNEDKVLNNEETSKNFLTVYTDEDYTKKLITFFKNRRKI